MDLVRARLAAGDDVDEDEYRMAEETCDACFWSSDEYLELTTHGPLMNFALDWIRRRDVGLEAKDLSVKEEQAVLYVSGEIEAAKARRLKAKGKQHAERRDGETGSDL